MRPLENIKVLDLTRVLAGPFCTMILSDLIKSAVRQNRDIGAPTLLQQYDRKHQLKTRPIYHGTNFVVKLFTNETPPAKLLRTAIIRASNMLSPVKKLISHQLTG